MDKKQDEVAGIQGKCKMALSKWGISAVVVLVAILSICGVIKKYERIVEEQKQEIADLKKQVDEIPLVWDDMPTREITIDLIKSEITGIGELAAVEYLYTDAGKFEDPKKLFGVDIPFATKSFIAKWDGIIKAGVRIDGIKIDINHSAKEIIIRMPNAEILSHETDSNSIETLDEKSSIFNPVKVEDVRQFDAVNKEVMEERAIENGILDKAYENAKRIIENLVYSDVVREQGYTVKFLEIE